ncbi:hypothetical protein L195_g000341 [Trifolium pratense]|uniref:Uncharacterized protein n=1 Tax=Trifolium pratense TaxID=57577 RepID=A0A2K3NLL2_TRIPR|nr:hypothetical protein L195_g000341 [Trifolium pratense]
MFLNFDAKLVGSTIGHASVISCDSHDVVELWNFGWGLASDVDLVGLVKRGLLGDETKLELLETNNGLKVVSEQFEEFCRLRGRKHSGNTFETLVVETQFETESSDSGTRRRQSTLSFGYLIRKEVLRGK